MFQEDFTNGAGHGLTAAGAYRFGRADGEAGQRDDHRTFAPFEAHYAHGYMEGQQAPRRAPLALTTPVMLWNGVYGVISGLSTADCRRYQVSVFNRHFWRMEHQWVDRGRFEVISSANKTATAA